MSTAELARNQARHEKDIDRLEREAEKLREAVHLLERRLILSVIVPVIVLIVTIVLKFVEPR
jgi:putative copper export protein